MPGNPLTYRPAYRRRLPHLQPPGATLFVTFRLAGSLPRQVLEQLRAGTDHEAAALAAIKEPDARARRAYLEQRRHFARWDLALDANQSGPAWLQDAPVARIVAESLHNRDGRVYDLFACCIMPNHVHLVHTPRVKADGTYHSMTAIMHSLKRYTAQQANRILGRDGAFWQAETYDHVVRDEAERGRVVEYVLNNPVKAGLVERWQDWEWSYSKHPL